MAVTSRRLSGNGVLSISSFSSGWPGLCTVFDVPTGMIGNEKEALDIHKRGPIVRRAGAGENAGNLEGHVLLAADTTVHRHHVAANRQVFMFGYFRAHHCGCVIARLEDLARLEFRVEQLGEQLGSRADNAEDSFASPRKSPRQIGIAKRDVGGRSGRPCDPALVGVEKFLVIVPGNIFDRAAEIVDRVEQQVKPPPLAPTIML